MNHYLLYSLYLSSRNTAVFKELLGPVALHRGETEEGEWDATADVSSWKGFPSLLLFKNG